MAGVTRKAFFLFAALGAAWGIPYALTKIAVGELSPQMLVLARTGLAAAVLLPIALARHQLVPALRRWKPLLAFAIIEICIPWFFLNAAHQHLSSSVVGLVIATVPLAGLALAYVTGRAEPMTASNWLGIALGLIGVGAIVGLNTGGTSPLGLAMLLVVIVGYAAGPAILARHLSDVPGLGVMAAVLTISAVIYVPIVALTNGWPTAPPSMSVTVSVVVLAVVCTALAFMLMFALVAEVGPVRMTTITYLNPAVAVLAGAVLLDEPITPAKIVGFAFVIAGSYLVQSRARTAGGPAEPGPPVTEAAPPMCEPRTSS